MHARWLALVPFLAIGAIATPVLAQRPIPVAVLRFEGPAAPAARRAVVGVLEDDRRVTVVDPGITDATADRAGALASGPQGIEGVCRQLQVRIVLQGHVEGRGARRHLTLFARDATGREIATAGARIGGGAVRRRTIEGLLATILEESIPILAAADRAARAEEEARQAPPPPPPAPPPAPAHWGADPALVTLSLGASLRSRSARIELDDGTHRSYDASPYVDLFGRAELRPLAHEQSYARGLYAVAEAGGAVGLSSQHTDASGTATRVSTTYYHLAASVGYLVPIEGLIEVGAGIGAGYDAFQLENNGTLPTVEYPYLRPAVRLRVRALDETVVVSLEGGYRALFSRDGLGERFGADGASFGWDVSGGISGTLDFGGFYVVEAGYAQYVHSFSGGGSTGVGTSGTDGGYRIALGVGYAIR